MVRRSRVAALGLAALVALYSETSGQNLAFSLFERYLESLRVQVGIPGMSVALVQNGQIAWEMGFGQADVESFVATRPDTPYHVADITQTFTTVLLAQCAERGLVKPDDPVREWVPQADPPATLRQLLSHTSGSTGRFRYDPGRFALLTGVVEACTRQPYRQALALSILDPAAMITAVPGRDVPIAAADAQPLFDAIQIDRYSAALQRVATPYKVDNKRRATRNELPPQTIDASHGLIASVRDLATYDAALDRGQLVGLDTLAQTWTNGSANGLAVPTTLGWFAQTYEGQRLVWHFGLLPDAYSAMILKVPGRRLTLIMLANSDRLSAPFSLQNGDVTSSLFAQTFLRLFL